MVQMSMVNPSHGKYEHGKSKSCEAYHVKCAFWHKRASPFIYKLLINSAQLNLNQSLRPTFDKASTFIEIRKQMNTNSCFSTDCVKCISMSRI